MTIGTEFESFDMLGLAELVRGGEITPGELLDCAIERVESNNEALNAVTHVAQDIARAAISAGLPDGPFAGVPYLLKDLYVLHQGMPTSNGSVGCAVPAARYHSTLTERLLASGLVIFGKTNTPEMGLNATTESAALGACRNPWDLSRSAGGSSGGAAAAVAARILPGAHATDGGGSIRIPASNCGLYGLKPTRARNPSGPDVGEGWSGLSTGHAVTRSVRDSAALLDATSGPAAGDPYVAPLPSQPFLAEVGAPVESLRIALWTEGLAGETVDEECVSAATEAAALLEELGHKVELRSPPIDMPKMREAMQSIIGANVAAAVQAAGTSRGRPVTMSEVEPATWALAEQGESMSGKAYAQAVVAIHAVGREMGRFFEQYDILSSPTLASPPLPLGTLSTGDDDPDAYFTRLADAIPFTPLFNVSGCPAASLPLHWTADGLPVGVQFGAGYGREDLLFRLSAQVEAAKPWFDRAPGQST